ncbi:TonB-dependent receptor [Fulvivirga lutimaris]|uniref:TonB-dependent receptor n=1 Tax=Fulvivirga lutimaris TaxID=1819566 RepID=UPI0012BD6595|nr:TonB-dependent receptor [Fulvivirga lutimaris]MTI39028.1 TonB-dependent receptor [Fulvivirga lutimaris]
MRLKAFSIILLFTSVAFSASAQFTLSGKVLDGELSKPLPDAEVFIKETSELQRTSSNGEFSFKNLSKGKYTLIIFASGYNTLEQYFDIKENIITQFELQPFSNELSEVVISQKREEVFSLSRLNPVEGTSIYAGKKSEIILLDQAVANMAANNARQIYAQVVGLNIYENNDAGLQLNVGGRGLDPNRTANFNTRQNGYDISADVLGYPESYYTPPAEALSEIQVIRGAASLQYGTQFGGLINFKLNKPDPTKKIELTSRQTVGSFNLFTSFNSLSGTIGKFSYYTYFNYKQGDGFRPNSEFDSKNFFTQLNYNFSDRTRLSLEGTYLSYLSKQPGGLTDTQFKVALDVSIRNRNWFEVDWKLAALKFEHKLSSASNFSLNLFGLNAERNALGFRGDPQRPERNPITEIDDPSAFTRDLIKGQFDNWGVEAKYLTRYQIARRKSVFLIGSKYYKSENTSVQGAGTNATDPNFTLQNDQYPSYPNQSNFEFPNKNIALFAENIIFVNDNLSITPGVRFEHIKTASEGKYTVVRYNNAGNEIFRQDTTDNRSFERSFALLGLGVSNNFNDNIEFYANISQNYRSVTFSDIRVVNPTFIIDPNIRDERGFTSDFGFRGKWQQYLSFDVGGFLLNYNDRIGTILVEDGPNKGDRVRKNIGDALIYGTEVFLDWNLASSLDMNTQKFSLNPFVNLAITSSSYRKSEENNVKGKVVEFIPLANLKTGLKYGYKNLLASVQYTYLSQQYTDAENTKIPAPGDSREGIIGEIPSYGIMDISLSYRYKFIRLEAGINNLLDEEYFTRRATGYPGPGIIPSATRSFYTTLQVKL